MAKPNGQTSSAAEVEPIGQRQIDRHVLAGLIRAVDWFDNGLQNVLASRGFKPLHRTQSMIMVHVASGIESPADIAREMGLTRQNVHHMAKTLINEGLIEQAPDPLDPRRIRYRLAGGAVEIRSAALDTLSKLEAVLVSRIGEQAVAVLKQTLAADWGAEVQNNDQMVSAIGADAGGQPRED